MLTVAANTLGDVLFQLVPYIGAAIGALTLAAVYRLTGRRLDELQAGSRIAGSSQGASQVADNVRTEMRNGIEARLDDIHRETRGLHDKVDELHKRVTVVEKEIE